MVAGSFRCQDFDVQATVPGFSCFSRSAMPVEFAFVFAGAAIAISISLAVAIWFERSKSQGDSTS